MQLNTTQLIGSLYSAGSTMANNTNNAGHMLADFAGIPDWVGVLAVVGFLLWYGKQSMSSWLIIGLLALAFLLFTSGSLA